MLIELVVPDLIPCGEQGMLCLEKHLFIFGLRVSIDQYDVTVRSY